MNENEAVDARVALFHGAGDALELRTIPIPPLAVGEVLVRVRCCTLCGSDIHTYRGAREVETPTVLGHEIVGQVVATAGVVTAADDGAPVNVGDRITWTLAANCGQCDRCDAGLPQKCRTLFKYGHKPFSAAQPLTGGLADHCVLVLGSALFRVPEAIDDRVAAMANCATATVAAAFRAAGRCREQAVLIQGAGALGLTAAAMASYHGAREVIVSDLQPARLETAQRFGATIVVALDRDGNNLDAAVRAATDGDGVDLAIDLSGAATAMQHGVDLMAIGGRYVWVGAVFPCGDIAIDPEQIVRRLLTIHGVHNYAPDDLATALRFLESANAEYPFDELVPETFRLSRVNEALSRATKTTAPRVAVVPD